MKRVFILLLNFTKQSFSQDIIRLDPTIKIANVCNNENIIADYLGEGYTEPICSLTDSMIINQLNEKNTYFKDKKNINKEDDGAMVLIVINCKGKVVDCSLTNKTKDPLLDTQILNYFKTLVDFKPGILKNKNVDSGKFYNLDIKKGKFSIFSLD